MSARVCPCIWCQCDHERGRPMRLARWRDNRLFWAPGRVDLPTWKMGFPRADASYFGPQHTARLRRNKAFVIVKPAKQPPRPQKAKAA